MGIRINVLEILQQSLSPTAPRLRKGQGVFMGEMDEVSGDWSGEVAVWGGWGWRGVTPVANKPLSVPQVHVNLLLLEARMQAALLYALRAITRYMT